MLCLEEYRIFQIILIDILYMVKQRLHSQEINWFELVHHYGLFNGCWKLCHSQEMLWL